MNCKNCESNLRTDFAFCPTCGARVVQKRLTFGSLAADIYERVFNIDSSIYRTIRDLTVRPDRVVQNYVSGIRRKYMNPLNYLGLAIFISGAIFYAIRHFGMEEIDFDIFGTGVTNDAPIKVMDAVMEYSSFVFLLYIPILGLSGYLSLNQQNYNLPEYLVGSGYVLAHISILLFLPAIFVIMLFPEHYVRYSLVSMFFMFGYSLWAFFRLGKYGFWGGLLRGFTYLILSFFGYMAISIGINILLLLTGEISMADFKPVEK